MRVVVTGGVSESLADSLCNNFPIFAQIRALETDITQECMTAITFFPKEQKVVMHSFFLGRMQDVLIFMDKEDDTTHYKIQSDIPLSFLDGECTIVKIRTRVEVVISEFEALVREKPIAHYQKKIDFLKEALRILSSSWKAIGAFPKNSLGLSGLFLRSDSDIIKPPFVHPKLSHH